MIKNIIIAILAFLCVIFFVYAIVQKTAAEKSMMVAIANEERAHQAERLSAEAAERARLEAMQCQAALVECKTRKK